jgi:hypothetical protein
MECCVEEVHMDNRPHVLVLFDRVTGEVTTDGSMSDGRSWNSAILDVQRFDRNLRCFALVELTTNGAPAGYPANHGYNRLPSKPICAAREFREASLNAAARRSSDLRWLWRSYVFTTVFLMVSGII